VFFFLLGSVDRGSSFNHGGRFMEKAIGGIIQSDLVMAP